MKDASKRRKCQGYQGVQVFGKGNCQIGVFLTYASAHGHVLLDRALYLPQA